MLLSSLTELEASHRPADDQVSLVGSVRQTHPWIREPASGVDADVAPLVWRHGVNHVEHHLKHTSNRHTLTTVLRAAANITTVSNVRHTEAIAG